MKLRNDKKEVVKIIDTEKQSGREEQGIINAGNYNTIGLESATRSENILDVMITDDGMFKLVGASSCHGNAEISLDQYKIFILDNLGKIDHVAIAIFAGCDSKIVGRVGMFNKVCKISTTIRRI